MDLSNIPIGLHVVSNAYGDLQIVGDITLVPYDEATSFLQRYAKAATRGAWLLLPFTADGIKLLHVAWGAGFRRAHSARNNVITLQCWNRDEPNPTPTDAFTDVGAGAFVVDKHGRLLGIRERYDKSGRWHCPGGHCDAGESFVDAAVREAWEETGVRCTAIGVVGARHLPSLPPVKPDPATAALERLAHAEQSCRFGCANLGVFVLCYACGDGIDLSADASEISETR
jgi:8-oxo-dGTP pyrophosphatase MutT (NUDIX family)